ncbi:Adenylate kinase 7 [Blyttiomyces sp. JEL0837]|nr:Adenylate kinase 7 [Blyttiomyces sp. JEL0837]
MRCFISNVDSAIGHNLSRLLASTVVGSRKESEGEEDEGSAEEDPDNAKKQDEKVHDTYKVWGTLTERLPDQFPASFSTSTPGAMIETGDKKKDSARREAIDKFAVLGKKPRWVQDVVDTKDKEALKAAILASDVIIYDTLLSLDESAWAIEMLSEVSDSFLEKPKTFIAISSVMTWAKTKLDQDDPEAFLAEDEYRRRKPHPNFKNHIAIEKNVIKFGKKMALRTYVVAAGLVYHSGDSIFHYLFKSAWHNADELICYGDGSNVLPTIHVDDLCNVIVEVAETLPEPRYLLAIDDSKSTLMEITKAISDGLGNGKVKKVAKESALLNKGLPQADFDMLLVNLRLEPGHVKDMNFEWKYEAGIIENLSQLIQEYKDARGLLPLKVALHGPPASGKSFLAKKIAEQYEIHLIEVDAVVQEAIARLERRAGGHLLPEEADDDTDADRELLEELKEAAKANNGRYPEEQIINFMREKLKSMPCRNQGFILDGYPTTLDEASQLLKGNEEDAKEEKSVSVDEIICPEFVISLEASDEFIKDRVMNLPESVIADTKNSEEALTRRLEEFRNINTDENTVLNFFDEIEIHPLVISVETNNTEAVMSSVTNHLGKPRNYGPTPEQLEAKRKAQEEAEARESALAEEERQKREKDEADRHLKAVAEWNARMDEIRKQEQEVLEAQSVPLRNYLMKYVMPTLTSGLIDVCKVRPEDPVDYLAEFLFKHNNSSSS